MEKGRKGLHARGSWEVAGVVCAEYLQTATHKSREVTLLAGVTCGGGYWAVDGLRIYASEEEQAREGCSGREDIFRSRVRAHRVIHDSRMNTNGTGSLKRCCSDSM